MEKRKVLALISLIVAIVLLIGVSSFAGPCPVAEGEKPMKCHWLGEALKGLAVVMAASSAIRLFSKEKLIGKGIATVEILNGLYGLCLVFFLIGTCMHEEMVCNTVMKPFTSIILIAYVILTAIAAFESKAKN